MESWIVGLIAVVVAGPVAVASYLSAVRSSRAGGPATEPVRLAQRARPAGRVADGQHRHYRRRTAA